MAKKKQRPPAAESSEKPDLHLPAALREQVEDQWARFRQEAEQQGLRVPDNADFHGVMERVWACSEFAADSCIQQPELLVELLDSGDLLSDCAAGELQTRVQLGLAEAEDEFALGYALRQLRRREMVRIAWRDLAGWASLEEVLRDLSDLADACVQGALDKLHA